MTQESIANGEFVADHLNDGDVDEANIQPNGVDLTVNEIYRSSGNAHFFEDGYSKPNRTKIRAKEATYAPDMEIYSLPTGSYQIIYSEKVEIPDGYVGRVYPRSRLMRCGLHLTSALWDQGYEGIGEGLLQVPMSINQVTIPTDMPIAQMAFMSAEDTESYEGSHQEERIALVE